MIPIMILNCPPEFATTVKVLFLRAFVAGFVFRAHGAASTLTYPTTTLMKRSAKRVLNALECKKNVIAFIFSSALVRSSLKQFIGTKYKTILMK